MLSIVICSVSKLLQESQMSTSEDEGMKFENFITYRRSKLGCS